MSSLRAAAAKGELLELQILIDDGEDINATDRNGGTALHLAAFEGHVNVIEELIDAGATVDTMNRNGQTALHLCSIRGHTDIVRTLLNHGADRSAQTKYSGMTALHLASHNGHSDVVQVLLDIGGDDILDYIGKNGEFYSMTGNVREVFKKHRQAGEQRSPTSQDGAALESVSPLTQFSANNKRRKSRSHSLEKISYSQGKENSQTNSLADLNSLASQSKKSKGRRSRSQSFDNSQHHENGSETNLLIRPEPVKIEESEETHELHHAYNMIKGGNKKGDLLFPPIPNRKGSGDKTKQYNVRAKNTVTITDKKFDFSEKHKQRMKQSVFDRLTGT